MPGKISGPAPAYGEVVKRQLDIFDIEGSLNEVRKNEYLTCRMKILIYNSSPTAVVKCWISRVCTASELTKQRDPVLFLVRYLR